MASGMVVIKGISLEVIFINPRLLKLRSFFMIAISIEETDTIGITKAITANTLPYPSAPTIFENKSLFNTMITKKANAIRILVQKQIFKVPFRSLSSLNRCWTIYALKPANMSAIDVIAVNEATIPNISCDNNLARTMVVIGAIILAITSQITDHLAAFSTFPLFDSFTF